MTMELRKAYPGLKRKRYRLRRQFYAEKLGAEFQPCAAEPAAVHDRDQTSLKMAEQVRLLQDQLLRARADYDNFRKRMQQQQKLLEEQAAERIVQPLLPVLDHFALALQNAAQTSNASSLMEGIQIIHRELLKALGDIGLSPIAAEGELFDPYRHEAVGVIETDEAPENSIVSVMRDGYKLGDRVIRPALVQVAKKPQ
ncbi:MAG: hypothetical protein Kow0059_02650 [Candidatus Sumerlaeia bacterium]